MNKRERQTVSSVMARLERVERFLRDETIMVGRVKRVEYANASDFKRDDVPALGQKASALAVFKKEHGSELALLFGLRNDLAVLLEKPVRMPYLAPADTHLRQ